MTRILKVNAINPEKEAIGEASEVIKNGGVVVFPTETVYGIGANAFDGNACKKIFNAKNRPMDNPLIVHISKLNQLDEVATGITDEFIESAKILWPGPISFILKKNKNIPNEVSANLETIAVRMPAHPIALALIEQSGVPIAAPSANISKKPSSTRIEHVIKDFDGKVDLIIDGGDTAFGIESTIVNMTVNPHVLLRPGAYTIEELEKYLGKITIPKSINTQLNESETAIAPGMKYRHYAPETKLLAVKKELITKIPDMFKNKKFIILCSSEMSEELSDKNTMSLGSEKNLYEITKNLFDSFRKLDKIDAEIAFIQSFPERGIGFALMNRILKASGHEEFVSVAELKNYS
ncbi:MAG: L-threonylcarbamoyladenylate synthase [Candidatus Micrarchaeaceae archaeon]|jgi:L-threonylcarbamoyladenylate synthase